ncbi:MAG TPA: RDD family protein [Blastocatellia bacterium]|nr:RDD family protein [Blastocatellia bacterium]
MKCEKCQQELPGAAVICRSCGYNNALLGIGDWRNKRDRVLKMRTDRHHSAAPARRTTDSTVLRFPTERAAAAEPAHDADLPAWRRQVAEKVRRMREQREAEAVSRPQPHQPEDVNPLVAAAIRRIRRTSPAVVQPAAPFGSAGAQATAHALEYDEQPEQKVEPRPDAQGVRMSSPAAIPHSSSAAAPKRTEIIPVSSLLQPEAERQAETAAPVEGTSAAVMAEPSVSEEAFIEDEPEPEPQPEQPRPAGERAVPLFIHGRAGKAPFLARIAAAIIDLTVIAFSLLPFFTTATLFNVDFTRGTLTALAALGLVMSFLYHLLTTATAGRTCGMAVFRIRVADAADESLPPSPAQAIRRAAGAVVSLLFIPLNLLVITLSPERQSLSDQLSGTVVVRQ